MERVTTKYSNPEHNEFMARRLRFFSTSMYNRGFLPTPLSEETIFRAHNLLVMNNEMAAFRLTPAYQAVAMGWRALKLADRVQIKDVGCMDGRDSAILKDDLVEIWSVPAAQIALIDRSTGETLEPWQLHERQLKNLVIASPDLIEQQKYRAKHRQEVFVLAKAHAQNRELNRGCAAWDGDIAPRLVIPEGTPPAIAHADFLETYTLEPIRDAHNAHKDPDQSPLMRIGMSGILYTDDYDMVFRNLGDTLSSKEAEYDFKSQVRNKLGVRAEPGTFTELLAGNTPMELDDYLRLTKTLLNLVENLMDETEFSSYHQMSEDFLRKHNPRFTRLQEHIFKVVFGRYMMLQHLIDFSQLQTEHYYSKHREEVMGISERGNPPLQRHPIQAITIIPATLAKSVRYSGIGLDVLGHAENSGSPYIAIIASDVPDIDYKAEDSYLDIDDKAVRRAGSNNLSHFASWANSFKEAIKNGNLVPLPAAVGQDSQRIASLFDHSYQAPLLFGS